MGRERGNASKQITSAAARTAAKLSARLFKRTLLFLAAAFGSGFLFVLVAVCAIVLVIFGSSSKGTSGGRADYSGSFTVTQSAVLIWDYFTGEGYTEIQTAAILGNLQWESGLDFTSGRTSGETTVRGIAQWTSYHGTNKLERYAESVGGDWDDPEVQCACISETLQGTNPYCSWYENGMSRFYETSKADFWEGDLYEAAMAFFCCFEDPEEYPDGCNSHGFSSAGGCLSISFDCGNGYGRYPYAQAYLDYFTGNGPDISEEEGGMPEYGGEPEGGMEIPHYIQGNYSGVAWGNTDIGTSGCGPTCLAMVVSYLQEEPVTPVQVIGWCGTAYLASTGSGYGSSWELFPAAAGNYGIGYRKTVDRSAVDAALDSGCPVIAREAPGSFFSSVGHFIVIRGITDAGTYLVNDPAAKYPVNREFTWEEISRPGNFYMIFSKG